MTHILAGPNFDEAFNGFFFVRLNVIENLFFQLARSRRELVRANIRSQAVIRDQADVIGYPGGWAVCRSCRYILSAANSRWAAGASSV